jgi:hypothetical protein
MSRLEDFATLIDDALDDESVAIEAGKLELRKQAGLRRIIFVRTSGEVVAAASPGRVRLGTPVSGVATRAVQVWTRKEQIEVTLRAVDETALDTLFDAFLDALFQVIGPNGLPLTYEWAGGDSSEGGAHRVRQPAIKLNLRLDLRSLPTARTHSVAVAATEADVNLAGVTVSLDQP